MVNKRNGELDLLKFIFALFIMILHYKYRPVLLSLNGHSITLSQNGFYAVVFFFIVSGALFSSSLKNKSMTWEISPAAIAIDTKNYVIKKYLKLVKMYLLALSFYIVNDIVFNHAFKQVIVNLFYNIPSVLLLGQAGFDRNDTIANNIVYFGGYYVGASWYISALFMMYIVFYPLIRWSYAVFTKVLAPVLFIICLYINLSVWNLNITDSRLYPVIPFLLGIIIGDAAISDNVSSLQLSKFKRYAVCCVEAVCYIMLMAFLCISTEKMPYTQYPMLFITGLGVFITCSRLTEYKLFDRQFFYTLGDLSFILYLLHIPTLVIIESVFDVLGFVPNSNARFFITAASAICISCVVLFVSKKISAYKLRSKSV